MDRNLLIFDTGPIRELVTYRAVHELQFERLRSQLQFFANEMAYKKFTGFVGSFPRKATTSGVVLELYHWIRKTEPDGHSRIWSLVYEEFRGMGMQEETIKLLEMPEDLVTRYGPADISLLHLAKRQMQDKPAIVTIDRKLETECLREQIQVFHLQELLTRQD